MASEKELEAEYARLIRNGYTSERVFQSVRDAFGMVMIIPRIYSEDSPVMRVRAGVVLDLKFKTAEEAWDPDPRLIALLQNLIQRPLLRYPDNPLADKATHHALYTVDL